MSLTLMHELTFVIFLRLKKSMERGGQGQVTHASLHEPERVTVCQDCEMEASPK